MPKETFKNKVNLWLVCVQNILKYHVDSSFNTWTEFGLFLVEMLAVIGKSNL